MSEHNIKSDIKPPLHEDSFRSVSPLGEPKGAVDDDERLRKLGKRPLLNDSFGFMSTLGLSCSTLCSCEGVLVASVPGLLNGGPAGVIWGYLINWTGIMAVCLLWRSWFRWYRLLEVNEKKSRFILSCDLMKKGIFEFHEFHV
jgi:hypothetical protein